MKGNAVQSVQREPFVWCKDGDAMYSRSPRSHRRDICGLRPIQRSQAAAFGRKQSGTAKQPFRLCKRRNGFIV